MKIDKTWMIGLGVALSLPLAGCPGDDTGTTASDESTTAPAQTETTAGTDPSADTTAGTTMGEETMGTGTGTTGEPQACPGSVEGGAADGETCTANADCASGVCTIYTDVPVNDDAVCAAAADDCSTRITGTVFDFSNREPIEGANVLVAAALQAALNPGGATAIVEATSGADGRFDVTSSGPITATPIGIVALSSAEGYFLTATGVAAPYMEGGGEYNVGTNIHDVWAVPETSLQDWSDVLAEDATIPPDSLPLGTAGGVVGLVRDATGTPLANAEVASTNPESTAFIRYLQDDGSFTTDRTSDTGVFIIIDPMLAEGFEVSVDGGVVGGGSAGSADGAVFTLIVNAG